MADRSSLRADSTQLGLDLRVAWKDSIDEMIAAMRTQGWSGEQPTRAVIFRPGLCGLSVGVRDRPACRLKA